MLVVNYKDDQVCVLSPPQQSTYKCSLINTLGKKGSRKARFNYISGISADNVGIIYVADLRKKRFHYIRV